MEIYLLRAPRFLRWRESLTRSAWQREGLARSMVTEQPRLGHSAAYCPYCCENRSFTEHTVYRMKLAASDENESASNSTESKFIQLTHAQKQQQCGCSGQICETCGGLVIFVGPDVVYPYAVFPPVCLKDLPADLRVAAIAAYQISDTAPAIAAAGLRHILEQVCSRAIRAMQASGSVASISPAEEYVSFLEKRLPNNTIKNSLITTCMSEKKSRATDRIYWSDSIAEVSALMVILDAAATALAALLVP